MSINIKPSKKGTFTAAAKKHGKSVQGFASQVLAHKENYSPAMVKKANFARNASKWKKGEDGIVLPSPKEVNYGSIGTGLLTGIDLLLPKENIQSPVLRPITQTNPLAYGTGSSALKKGGKIKYDEGGEVKKKSVTLNMNKRKTNPDLYIPFGENAQLAYDEGWYPATGVSNGQITYNSNYDLFNSVIAPRRSNKNIPAPGGRVSLVGNENGLFDININDVDGVPVKTLAKGIPFERVNSFITRPDNIVSTRQQQIINTTSPQKLDATAKVFKKGGKISPQSKNGMKILDDTTVEFVGDSHSDPSGGIPMAAHGKQVLVEGDETAYVSPIDKSVNVMGNMTNPLTGNKYKNDSKKLADKQARVEKYIDNGALIVNNTDPMDKWDSLKFNSGKAMMQGGTFRKNQIIQAKEHLAEMQNAHLELKYPEMKKAKYGMKIGEGGVIVENDNILKNIKGNSAFNYDNYSLFPNPETSGVLNDVIVKNSGRVGKPDGIVFRNKPSIAFNTPTILNRTSPSYSVNGQSNITPPIPTNAENLSFTQILPELYTAATNKQEGVFSQNFTPELFDPYSISLQDKRNAATSQFRASSQFIRDNPAAQAQLAAQAYSQTNDINAEEFRINQGIFNDINNKNINLMNEAKSANLNISDRAYTRQAQAKSNTKTQNRVILQSIADKMHQNQLEQDTIKLYENLFKFRFDPETGQAQNYNITDFEGHGIVGDLLNTGSEQTVRVKNKNGKTETTTTTDPASVTLGRQYENIAKRFNNTQNVFNGIFSTIPKRRK